MSGPVAMSNGDEPRQVELWAGSDVAVAFQGGTQVGLLRDLTLSFTDDRRLRLEGVDGDGQPSAWEATAPERVTTRWAAARVAWPSGEIWPGATVTGSQHGVRVVRGSDVTDLPGARLQAVGSQRWIVDGSTRIAASDGRGCGCSGKRRG
jgi:hypothetical protein